MQHVLKYSWDDTLKPKTSDARIWMYLKRKDIAADSSAHCHRASPVSRWRLLSHECFQTRLIRLKDSVSFRRGYPLRNKILSRWKNKSSHTYWLPKSRRNRPTWSAARLWNNSSAIAEMDDRCYRRHGPKRSGLLCPFRGGSWVPV